MEIYSVEILNPKAKRLLDRDEEPNLADLELMAIRPRTPITEPATPTEEQRAEARERIMRGGSQTLDVEEMIAYVKETRDRTLPFRDE